MVKKITDKEIADLKEGDIVVLQPVNGEPFKVFNSNDSEDTRVFIVTKRWGFGDIFDLSFHDLPDATINFMKVKIGPIHKKAIELVSENRWWLYEK